MREYCVRDKNSGDVRIVSAKRPSSALAHVVTPQFSVSLATAADAMEAFKLGHSIEVAGEIPALPIEDTITAAGDAQ